MAYLMGNHTIVERMSRLDTRVMTYAVRITDQDVLERLASVWATKWDGSWIYHVRNGYFYLYDEDEQRVLEDSGLVFSVKPTKVFAVNVGRSQTRHQF